VTRRAVKIALALWLAGILLPRLAQAAGTAYTSCLDKDKPAAAATAGPGDKPGEKKPEAKPVEEEEPGLKTPSGEEEKEFNQLVESVKSYEAEAKEYRKEVQLLIEKKYDEKRRFLADNYEKAIRDLEVLQRKDRQDAIAQFEEFLSRYPDDPNYTPDAMYRLAELYYEKTGDDYDQALAEWREAVKKTLSQNQEPPPEPVKDYGKSIAVYQKLLSMYPAYRFADGALYLLAYCLGETNKNEESQKVFLSLIEKYPKSQFIPETWVRIGEYHFNEVKPDSLQNAAEAYSHLYAWPEHALFPGALYKLGWTYYRMDDFQHAVESFTKLLDYYTAASKKSGKAPQTENLWPESVQYTAISFADDKWGGVAKAQQFFVTLGGRSYEAEIFYRLGDVLFDQTKFTDAVAAYKLVIAKDPLSPEAPKIQAKIITAWAKDRQFEKEAAEREVLNASYGPNSGWYQKNKGDPDLVKDVRELTEASLRRAASFHHEQAIAYKQQGKLELAVAEFRVAARAYGDYLARFPHAKNAYELKYYYADCLFNSLDFEKAALAYASVRDDNADNKYQNDAAISALLSWQNQITRLQREGKLEERKVLTSKDRKEKDVIKAEALPLAYQSLVRESDLFVKRLPKNEKAATVAYKAAELFYVYNDYEEARCRMEDVVARWPGSEVGQYAANLIIESYLTMKDWSAVEKASDRLLKLQVSKNKELAASLQKFKLGGRFNLAMSLMEKGSYDEAAKKFVELVAEDPKHEFADKALYNAASCYEQARRFETALKLYERIFANYPKSTFADDSLFRVAYNAENTYDFDKAVDKYLLLVDKYPTSKQRKAALFNAARSLENLQRYDDAAKQFQRYADVYKDSEDAAETLFHAAIIYEKTKEWGREIKALQDFITKFSRSPKQNELLVQSHLKIALAFKELGNERAARDEYTATVHEFERRLMKPDSNIRAAAAAAEAKFRLAEYDFEKYDKITLPATTNVKVLKKAIEAKLNELKRVGPEYNEVKKYKRPDWILAAFYRQAFMLERLATTVIEAPPPPEYKRTGKEEYLAAYQDGLAQFAQPYEDQAVKVYEEAIASARTLHVKNEWTKKIAESLARYRPKDYPILKDAKGDMLFDTLSPSPIVDSPEGPKLAPPPPPENIDQKLGKGEDK
jgi:TolA-binding protein